MDTRLLLSSFSKGSGNGIYELDMGGLTLTIGTNIEYAKWVNDGHGQQPGRFIPGVWSGSRFTYIPGAKTGMVLKASYVSGSHFFDKSVQALESMFPDMVDRAFRLRFASYRTTLRMERNHTLMKCPLNLKCHPFIFKSLLPVGGKQHCLHIARRSR